MTMLVGGVPGSSSRLSGGLAGVSGQLVSDVTPMRIIPQRSTLGTNLFPGLGRFRRSLAGLTTDATNTALGGVLVKWFDVATDLLVASITSDAAGLYDAPIYYDGTFYAWIWKAGSPNVFGGSDRVTPV